MIDKNVYNKISVKKESNTKNDIKVHHVKYEDGGFYLLIDNLKDYLILVTMLDT